MKWLTCEKYFSQFELQIHHLICNDFKIPVKVIENIVKREELEVNDDKVDIDLLNDNKLIYKGKRKKYVIIQDPDNCKLYKCLECTKISKNRLLIQQS